MKYDWITIALENGGVLTASKNAQGYYATMHWRKGLGISSEHQSTLPDALTALNSDLEDDDADECCPPPSAETNEPEKIKCGICKITLAS